MKNIRDNGRNAIITPISELPESKLDNLDRDIDYLKTLETPFSRRMLIPDPTSSGFELIPIIDLKNQLMFPYT